MGKFLDKRLKSKGIKILAKTWFWGGLVAVIAIAIWMVSQILAPTYHNKVSKDIKLKTKTFSGAWFSFQYPQSLFTISDNSEFLTFYQSLQEAQSVEKCVANKTGTMDHPCGEFLVFNIGVNKYPTDYSYSLKPNLVGTDPSLLKPFEWVDSSNRKWLLEGPVDVPGGSNLWAEYENSKNLYKISIQFGRAGFERFSGKTPTETNQLEASKEILNTFLFF